jgi:DNA-binding transcriptional regulator LsrR (DeoR family)
LEITVVNFYDGDLSTLRQINQVLALYYIEDKNQAEIAKMLNLSTAKVNRLLKVAREQGLIEIVIRTPFSHLFELESQLEAAYGLPKAIIIPALTGNSDTALQILGRAGAEYLLQQIRNGDTICISGGKTIYAIVEAIEPRQQYDVRVVPATGSLQKNLFTDANYLAALLATKLGGESYQLHAPALVDSSEERETFLSMSRINHVLEIGRHAQIALVGIGSVLPGISGYYGLLTAQETANWERAVQDAGAYGEALAYIFDDQGQLCLPEYNQRVIGLTIDELKQIPLTIGVAATAPKVQPIHGALHNRFLKTLITDESTAKAVLSIHEHGIIKSRT